MFSLSQYQSLFKSLFKGRVSGAIINYGLGSYIPQIVGFFLIPIYSVLISPTELGMVEIAASTQIIIQIISRAGLNGGISRYFFEAKSEADFRSYLFTTASSVFLFGLIVLSLGLFFSDTLIFSSLFPEVSFHPYISMSLISAFFMLPADWQRRVIQVRELSSLNAKLNVFYASLSILLTLLFVAGFRWGGEGIIFATLIVSIVNCILSLLYLRKDLLGKFQWTHFKYSIAYGFPLVPHHIAAWGHQFLGRWALGTVSTMNELGHLSFANRVVSPMPIFNGALSQAYSPVYLSWRSKLTPEETLLHSKRICSTIIVLGAWMVVGAIFLGRLFMVSLVDAQYFEAIPLVGLLAAAAWCHLLYTITTVELFHAKATAWISSIFIVATGINLSIIFYWKDLGAKASAYGQLAGGIVSVLLVWVLAKRHFPLPLKARPFITAVSVIVISNMAGFAVPLGSLSQEFLFGIGGFLFLSLFLYVGSNFHKEVKNVIQKSET